MQKIFLSIFLFALPVTMSATFPDAPPHLLSPSNEETQPSVHLVQLDVVDENCNHYPNGTVPITDDPVYLKMIGTIEVSPSDSMKCWTLQDVPQSDLAELFQSGLANVYDMEFLERYSNNIYPDTFSVTDQICDGRQVILYNEPLRAGKYIPLLSDLRHDLLSINVVHDPTITAIPLPTSTPIPTPYPPITYQGQVWRDENKNGQQDASEHGVADINVVIGGYCGDGQWAVDLPVFDSTTTNLGGYYTLQVDEASLQNGMGWRFDGGPTFLYIKGDEELSNPYPSFYQLDYGYGTIGHIATDVDISSNAISRTVDMILLPVKDQHIYLPSFLR